jgi:hypothetical protein
LKHVQIKKEGEAAQLLAQRGEEVDAPTPGAVPQPAGPTSGDAEGLTHGKSGSLRTS